MTRPRARWTAAARAAILIGGIASFVAAVDLVRWIRPALLLDQDRSWAAARLLLSLGVCAGAAVAGGLVAGVFLLWSRIRASSEPLEPLPLGRAARVGLTAAAIAVGVALRLAALERVPEVLWVDDISLIRPALELRGRPADFADATRPAPYGVAKPYGSVGVLYLEGYRAALRLFGTTVFGVRFPSALAGALSLVTGTLVGCALLPSGGGMLVALILAGLRWHLILSRWAWVMIVLAPIVDVATLVLLSACRRRSPVLAGAAGLVAGVGAHVYLSAWPAGAALALFGLWPAERGERPRPRLARSAAFGAGFLLCAAPLFLFREGSRVSYFARTADHNVFLEMARTRSVLPPFAAAADAFVAPWFLADPTARHDLPGRSRLGWLLGVPVMIALGRSLLRPGEPISGLLLANGLAVVAAIVAGGQADNPNGSRFAYLTTLTAVAAAAGVLWLVGLWRDIARRHTVAIVAVGALAVGGALNARDALLSWPDHAETFRGFHGEDTWIGRAAARWEAFGPVEIAPGVGLSAVAIEAVSSYRLSPDLSPATRPAVPARFRIRIVPAVTAPQTGERVVESVDDPRGRRWARVLARRA